MKNLAGILRESAEKYPKLTAVSFMGQDTDYQTLNQSANKIAHALREMGVAKGDRVAIYCINSPFFVASYFGIQKLGATVVTINLLLHPKEVQYILKDSGAKVVIFYELFAEAVAAIKDQLPDLKGLILIGKSDKVAANNYVEIMQNAPADPIEVDVDPKTDVAAILYTSGTTGNPKGAMLTHYNLMSNSASVAHTIGITHDDVILTVLPMFHSFAMTCCILAPVSQAGKILAIPKFDPIMVADAIQANQATLFFGVPSMYVMFLQLPPEKVSALDSLKYCISGGAAMPQEVMLQFEKKFGKLIYEGDGPTECSPVTTVNPIGGKRKIGSIGLPIRDVELKIVDDNGKELPVKTIGEIVVRGPNVMKGYFNLPEATTESFFGEWFRTGDLGEKDEEGYFYIVDRKKDMLIVNGINVYPRHVEEVLYGHPAVAEAAVIGVPDKTHGEIPKAYVVLKPGATASAKDIRKFCMDNLGRFEIPRQVVFLEKLPKSATGKILKRELRKDGEIERGVKPAKE
ncbi:long-chain fatty acid--CoA ligase [candidate division KSB1 bacterium]|nr:long-chain fatty acid--CoA ligase [candidate division KSB1 bacterium]